MKLSRLHGEHVYMLLLAKMKVGLINPYRFMIGTQDEIDLYTFSTT